MLIMDDGLFVLVHPYLINSDSVGVSFIFICTVVPVMSPTLFVPKGGGDEI